MSWLFYWFHLPHSATLCALPAHAPCRTTLPSFFFFFGDPTLAVAESIHSHPSSINEWQVREAAE